MLKVEVTRKVRGTGGKQRDECFSFGRKACADLLSSHAVLIKASTSEDRIA